MVGCAMRTKMPTGRYLHCAHGAPYFDNTLNLLALGLSPIVITLAIRHKQGQNLTLMNVQVYIFCCLESW